MKTLILKSLATAACLFVASSSYASLIEVAPEDFGGTGLGAVNTILTIQNTDFETGSVSFNGSVDVITGDAKKGASQTLTRTISQLGLASASAVRVVFNANEPNGAGKNSIKLEDLVLNFYSSTGKVLFSSGTFTPILFPNTSTGTGNSGVVFALDNSQAAAAQIAVFNQPLSGNIRVGLSASASLADGANETFFIANSPSDVPLPPASIPEPTTVALLGLGLLGFAASRHKSANSKNA